MKPFFQLFLVICLLHKVFREPGEYDLNYYIFVPKSVCTMLSSGSPPEHRGGTHRSKAGCSKTLNCSNSNFNSRHSIPNRRMLEASCSSDLPNQSPKEHHSTYFFSQTPKARHNTPNSRSHEGGHSTPNTKSRIVHHHTPNRSTSQACHCLCIAIRTHKACDQMHNGTIPNASRILFIPSQIPKTHYSRFIPSVTPSSKPGALSRIIIPSSTPSNLKVWQILLIGSQGTSITPKILMEAQLILNQRRLFGRNWPIRNNSSTRIESSCKSTYASVRPYRHTYGHYGIWLQMWTPVIKNRSIGRNIVRDLSLVASWLYRMAITRTWVTCRRYIIPLFRRRPPGLHQLKEGKGKERETKNETIILRKQLYEPISPTMNQVSSMAAPFGRSGAWGNSTSIGWWWKPIPTPFVPCRDPMKRRRDQRNKKTSKSDPILHMSTS